MPIPDLTAHGVLPLGRFDCNLPDVAARYCYNNTRNEIWQGLERFLAWASNQPKPANMLLDGSFTSDKEHPRDVDIVFDLEGCPDASRDHWFLIWAHERDRLKADYKVDFWVFFPGLPNDLREFFEYVRPEEAIERGMAPDSRKGLLRLKT